MPGVGRVKGVTARVRRTVGGCTTAIKPFDTHNDAPHHNCTHCHPSPPHPYTHTPYPALDSSQSSPHPHPLHTHKHPPTHTHTNTPHGLSLLGVHHQHVTRLELVCCCGQPPLPLCGGPHALAGCQSPLKVTHLAQQVVTLRPGGGGDVWMM